MQLFTKMLAGAMFAGFFAAVASAAQQQHLSFHVPTCDEFKDRLTNTQKRTGIIISNAQYEQPLNNDDSSVNWAIPNYQDFDVDLGCKGSMFLYMELQQTDISAHDATLARRGNNVIGAAIAAWTGWPKSRVMGLVNSLNAQIADDMREGKIYGEETGRASYDLLGGAKVHVSNGENGIRMTLISADGEQRIQPKNEGQE